MTVRWIYGAQHTVIGPLAAMLPVATPAPLCGVPPGVPNVVTPVRFHDWKSSPVRHELERLTALSVSVVQPVSE
jgi:hypothetical protein